MKKLLAVWLSIAMMLSLGVTAFAAEGEDTSIAIIGGADGPTSILIGQTDKEAQAEKQAALLAAAKEKLPYRNGVNVWTEGGYMTFADAAPVIKDGRTQVPFRAILEKLGAKVTYDNGNIEALFGDGGLMKLAIGSKVMTYQPADADAPLTTVEMDVAPYIDYSVGRTYVPVRFIGETLGLTVTWDSQLQTAYITDWDKLEDEIDTAFTEINELLTIAAQQTDPQKSYKTTSQTELRGVMEGQSKDALELMLEGEHISRGDDLSGKYLIGFDAGGYQPLLDAAGATRITENLDGAEVEFVAAGQKRTYLRSGLVERLGAGLIAEKGWLSLEDTDRLSSTSTLDLNDLVENRRMTVGSLIRALCADGSMGVSMGYLAPDEAAKLLTGVYASVFGDDAVRTSGKESSRTWNIDFNMQDLLNDLIKDAVVTADEADQLKAAFKESGMKMNFRMKVSARKDKITKSEMNMVLKTEELELQMKISGSAASSKGTIELKAPGVGEVEIRIESKTVETDALPRTAPADGEQVVTLEELLDSYTSKLVPKDN